MKNVKKLTYSALLLAVAYLLPYLTLQIPQIGSMLCPMHLPVLLCGFVCGWEYGLAVGIIAPLLRSFILGMPPMFPTAAAMAVELGIYGAVTGALYKLLPKKNAYIYVTLLIAMLAGRAAWGAVMFALMGLGYASFSASAFLAGAVVNAVPGIIIQIVLIPILVMALKKAKIIVNG